eukprot:scaffold303_cov318-Pavlova_lutheri.AAC.1
MSPRGHSMSPRGHSMSPRGHSTSPRGHSTSPRGRSMSPRGHHVPQRTRDVPQRTVNVSQRDILTWFRGTCGGFAKGSIARAKCIHVATNFLQTTIPFHCTTSGRYVFISFGNSRPMTSK